MTYYYAGLFLYVCCRFLTFQISLLSHVLDVLPIRGMYYTHICHFLP